MAELGRCVNATRLDDVILGDEFQALWLKEQRRFFKRSTNPELDADMLLPMCLGGFKTKYSGLMLLQIILEILME